MLNAYSDQMVERFAVRESLLRPFMSWKTLSPVLLIMAATCPIAAAFAIIYPLTFLRDNLDRKRIPLMVIGASTALTIASLLAGTVPVGALFMALGRALYGSPNWLLAALIWLIGSLWYSAPILIISGVIALGRSAGIDLTQERFLQPPRDGIRSLEKIKEAAEEELAAGDIEDATK